MSKNDQIAQLLRTVDSICNEPLSVNNGSGIDEVEARQRRRKIRLLQALCKRALWFVDTFHLDLMTILFKLNSTGETITLALNTPVSSQASSTASSSGLSPAVAELNPGLHGPGHYRDALIIFMFNNNNYSFLC